MGDCMDRRWIARKGPCDDDCAHLAMPLNPMIWTRALYCLLIVNSITQVIARPVFLLSPSSLRRSGEYFLDDYNMLFDACVDRTSAVVMLFSEQSAQLPQRNHSAHPPDSSPQGTRQKPASLLAALMLPEFSTLNISVRTLTTGVIG